MKFRSLIKFTKEKHCLACTEKKLCLYPWSWPLLKTIIINFIISNHMFCIIHANIFFCCFVYYINLFITSTIIIIIINAIVQVSNSDIFIPKSVYKCSNVFFVCIEKKGIHYVCTNLTMNNTFHVHKMQIVHMDLPNNYYFERFNQSHFIVLWLFLLWGAAKCVFFCKVF